MATDLYGVMYKPFNFDSTKVYPIVDYVYPGPQVEGVYYPFTRMSPRTDLIYIYKMMTLRQLLDSIFMIGQRIITHISISIFMDIREVDL